MVSYSLADFLAEITPNDLILTVNRRLASYLHHHYDHDQLKQGRKVWSRLQLYPVTAWLELVWEKQQDTRFILSDFQELVCWQQAIDQCQEEDPIINSYATASTAKETWKLIQQWQLSLADLEGYYHVDVMRFIKWATVFQSLCQHYQSLSKSELLNQVINVLKNQANAFSLPKRIFFVGFDDLSPAMKCLLATLAPNHLLLLTKLDKTQASNACRIGFESQQQELQSMVLWALATLAENPTASIGCILPNLTELRNPLIRLFTDGYLTTTEKVSDFPFNISGGDALNQFPIIDIISKLLKLNNNTLKLEELSSILRTPFIKGGFEEMDQRARFDAYLRSKSSAYVSVDCLLNDEKLLKTCPLFYHLLACFRSISSATERESVEHWTCLMVKQLQAWGWPGDKALTSIDYQLVERYKKLLTEFCSLYFLMPAISYDEAIQLLLKLVKHTLFQPKKEHKPIQVLGALEAAGMCFDYLWIAGLDNEAWPAPPAPNPFIPFEIQKRNDMPHATAERELQFSLHLTARFLQSANQIIFSYAEMDEDRPLRASPLIEHLPITTINHHQWISIEQLIFASKKTESYVDEYGPPVTNQVIKGGSGILKAQAACPFQAFARFRLLAQPLEQGQIGLAAHERGNLVHDCLATIWSSLKNHATLCQFTDEQLQEVITLAVNEALTKLKNKKLIILSEHFIALEKKRLETLLFHWLQLEKQRQPFEVICCEFRQTSNFGPLTLTLQIDRIDKLQDGTPLLIDYKTGKPSVLNWFGQRPEEPQLPLYAILWGETPGGLVFGQLRPGEMAFKGITAESDQIPGTIQLEQVKEVDYTHFSQLIAYWQTHLLHLANDFIQGKADVSPKESATCHFCELQTLCRVADV